MTIEEFIREVESKGLKAKINGSILTLHETSNYNDSDGYWAPVVTKTRIEPAFLNCDMLYRSFVVYSELKNISMSVFKLSAILKMATAVADTPVKERFKEQVWRLRWLHPDALKNDHSGYLCSDSDGYWQMTEHLDDATLFTSSDLEKLKEENPAYAPAIDAIKEPAVKENE